MKFYSKTPEKSAVFNDDCFFSMEECEYKNGTVFWYDQHAEAIHRILLEYAIEERGWDLLRKDETSKIFLFSGDEYFNHDNIKYWAETIRKQRINPKQFCLICMDENWKNWAVEIFKKFGVVGITIQSFNVLMTLVPSYAKTKKIEKRFSLFSRNYNKWRLGLYVELLKNNVLDNSLYTFNNVFPYGKIITFKNEDMVQDLKTIGIEVTPEASDWIKKMPYTFEESINITDKWTYLVYDKICSTGINLVVESHFDPFWHFSGSRGQIHPSQFSPAFATEKTYKAIACAKPFIIFSTPWFLKEFKQLGYKTFSPFIDESYDDIENDLERLKAISSEMKRLNELSESEFAELLSKCQENASHNLRLFEEQAKNQNLDENFEWLRPVIRLDRNIHTDYSEIEQRNRKQKG